MSRTFSKLVSLAGVFAIAFLSSSGLRAQALDMEINKTLTPSQYTPGSVSVVTYTVTVTNRGPTAAVNAPVRDLQPPGVTFTSWTCSVAAVAGNACRLGAASGTSQTGSGSIRPLTNGLPSFPVGDIDTVNGVAVDLAPGQTATFVITASIAANAYDLNTPAINLGQYPQGYILNNAGVRRPAGTTQTPNNEQDNVVAILEPLLSGDIGATKTGSIVNYTSGSSTNITYTFTVRNFSSGSPLSDIQVSDLQPANVTFNSWSCAITTAGTGSSGSDACPAPGTGSINTLVSLRPGAVATFTVNATVGAAATGEICNTVNSAFPAGVIVSQTLPDQPDAATYCINPLPATLSVTKNVTGAPAGGAPGTYNFQVTCTTGGGPFNGSVTLAGAATTGSTTISLPAGATGCVLSEPSRPAPPTNYSWDAPTFTPAAALASPVVSGSTPSATVTNPLTRNNVAVTLSKTISNVTGNGTNFPFAAATTFNYSMSCQNPTATYTGTITVAAGATTGSAAAFNVPAGSTNCTVTETGVPSAPTNYSWGTVTYTQPGTIPASGTASGNITNPLNRNQVTITANKTITGGPSGANLPFATNTNFPFIVTCTGNPAGTYSGNMTVLAGQTTGSGTVQVPQGSTGCTLAEGTRPAAPANYTWGAATYAPDATLVTPLVNAEAVGVTNPLIANPGTLTITKNVTGIASLTGTAASRTFPYSVTCATPPNTFTGNVVVVSGTLSGTATVSIPVGSTNCTISEGALPTPPTNYTWVTPPTYTQPSAGAMGAGGAIAGTITNALNRIQIPVTITKNVTGAPASGAPGTYNFTIACGNPTATYSGSVTITGTGVTGTSAAINIPAGSTNCNITEGTIPGAPTNYTWGAPSYVQPGAIPATGTDTGTITNPLALNQITVTANKTITGIAAALVPASSFPFSVVCAGNPGGTYNGTMTVAAGSLTGSGSVQVPAGSTGCVLSEGTLPAAPTNYTWGAPTYAPDATLVSPLAVAESVGVTNPLTRNNVAVTLSKTISNVTGNGTNFPFAAATTFNYSMSCQNPTATYTGTITVAAGATTGSAAAFNVPAGSTNCTVTETGVPSAPTNYSWGTVTYTQPGTIPASGTASGNITNPLNRNQVTITANKTITGGPSGANLPFATNTNFPFIVTCTGNPAGTYSGNMTVLAGQTTGSGTVQVPQGSTGCTLAEGTRPAAPANYTWGAATYAPDATLVTPLVNAEAVGVTNPLTQNAPNISVVKTITSAGIASPVVYSIVVSNTGGAGSYALTDTPLLGSGITAGQATCASPQNTAACPTVAANLTGSAPYTLAAAGTAIAGGASHTYTVTLPFTVTNAATQVAGSALCPTANPTASAGGLNNATTVSPNSGAASTVNVCRDVTPNAPNISVVKTITSAGIASPVVYSIVVSNTGGAGSYALTDTPLLGSGITAGQATCASPQNTAACPTVAANLTGSAPYTLAAAGTAIAGGASHTYTVTLPFTVTNAATQVAGSALCPTANPTASAGGLNNATTVSPNSGAASTVNVCRDVTPNAPAFSHVKTSGVVTPLSSPNQYSVSYTVTVTNNGGAPQAAYGLTDTPAFGAGVTISSATFSKNGGASASLAATPWTLASGALLAGQGAQDVYVITVNVAVNPVVATGTAADCTLQSAETGTGLLNRATLTPAVGGSTTVEACVVVPQAPNITVAKAVSSVPTPAVGVANRYSLAYTITVENNGGAGGVYSLIDTPQFGSSISIVSAAYALNGGASQALAAGSPPWTLATSRSLSSTSPNNVDIYVVTVVVDVAANASQSSIDCALDVSETGTGLRNRAELTFGTQTASSTVCALVPQIAHAKTVFSAPVLTGTTANEFSVVYRIDVSNTGGASGAYDLSDVPAFAPGVTIQSASVEPTLAGVVGASQTLTGSGPWVLATARTLGAALSDRYDITVVYRTSSTLTVALANCVLEQGETGTGLRNVAALTIAGAAINRDACVTALIPPVANNESTTTLFQTPVVLDAPSNDTDADGNVVRTTLDLDVAMPGQQTSITTAEGLWELFVDSADGLTKVRFSPANGYVGTATLPYNIRDNDGLLSNNAVMTVTVQLADVTTTITGMPATAGPATTVSGVAVTFRNNGPSPALGVTYSLQLTSGLTNVVISCGSGINPSYDSATGVITLSGASLPTTLPASAVAQVSCQLAYNTPANGGTIVITAQIATTTPEPPTGALTNTATATTLVRPLADLRIVKSGPSQIAIGGTITYRLVVTNGGPSDGDGSTVIDAMPPQLGSYTAICVSATGGATCGPIAINEPGRTISATIPVFPVGGVVEYEITAKVLLGNRIENRARTATPPGLEDPFLPNNDDSNAAGRVVTFVDAPEPVPMLNGILAALLVLLMSVVGLRAAAQRNRRLQ
jgi:uncharacterized repeat protein (TIGR01451 family)